MIPKKIHYCWFGGLPLPELAVKCIESWKKYCPDYEIIQWDETNVDLSSVVYMREAYEAKAWGFVPDVARLQIIYEHGGVYLDTDVELCKSLDELLSNRAFMGFEDKKHVALGLGFGAEPGNKLIGMFLEEYKAMHFVNDDGSLNRKSSPLIQTDLLKRIGLKQNGTLQIIDSTVIYPTQYFCPLSYETGKLRITEDTYSIHHYVGSWLTQKEREWDRKRVKVMTIFGKKVGHIIWCMVRFIRKMKDIGFGNALKLVMQKMKDRKNF